MTDNTMENCDILAEQIAGDMNHDELLDFVAYELAERFHDRYDEFQMALADFEASYGPLPKLKKSNGED